MAAAYAALVSLMNLIEQVSLLQDFVEGFSHGGSEEAHGGSEEAKGLNRQIADVAYVAEDIIESYIVDDISVGSTSHETMSSNQFVKGLQKVIENMDFMKKEVMDMKDLPSRDIPHVGSLRPPRTMNDHDAMVGFDDRFNQIMDKLTRQQSNLQIIPVTGMGGIGKTTLVKKVYDHPYFTKSFDICCWVTLSQVFNVREILFGLLGVPINEREEESSEYDKLGEKLHKRLHSRKYLIVMDDMWSTDAWDKLKLFIHDNNNGSRIIVTTRLSVVANYLDSSNLYEMNLLDENVSWSLLCRKAFGQEGCPHPELEEVGKKIARNCKGLPLSIVVIGGLLWKSKMTREFWEYIAIDISQTINSEDNGHFFKILSLSYNHLPIHLKPCFLYMGVYPEDHKIRVSKLIKLWVSEGFLKPNKDKSLEEVAHDYYLKELIERHLIMVNEWGSLGTMKTCNIHDLLRDLCLREAQKDKFLCVTKMRYRHISEGIDDQRRISFQYDRTNEKHWHQSQEVYCHPVSQALQSASYVRSLTCDFPWDTSLPLNFKLLRIFSVLDHYYRKFPSMLFNLRYIDMFYDPSSISLVHRIWNLQTLIVGGSTKESFAKLDIWKMPNLRHLLIDGICLSDPPPPRGLEVEDVFVLENLQTLSRIINLKCTEEVLKRIRNVKKLGIKYDIPSTVDISRMLNISIGINLGRLHKLQSLKIIIQSKKFNIFFWHDLVNNCVIPHSLKKLNFSDDRFLDLEDFTRMIGLLPNLENLILRKLRSKGEWNPIEGQFLSLKFLQISNCKDRVSWTADSIHFPVLERLVLKKMDLEILSGIGDITTLQSIQLDYCSKSTVASAKKILEEQKDLDNEGLRIKVSELDGIKVYE